MYSRKIGPILLRAISIDPFTLEIEHHKTVTEFTDNSLDALIFDLKLHLNANDDFNYKIESNVRFLFSCFKKNGRG